MKPLGTLKEFSKILRETIIPHLREDGFKGSMPTFRWISSPVIQVIDFEGTGGGGVCHIIIGIHLDFVSIPAGVPVIPKKLWAGHCMFHRRMKSLRRLSDGWPYTREGAEELVKKYLLDIRPFLHHFRQFPDAFLLVTPEALLQDECVRFQGRRLTTWGFSSVAEIFANLYEYLGDRETAQEFSEVAKRHEQKEKEENWWRFLP